MKVLLIYPPYGTVLNPYGSLPALTGFLKMHGIDVAQWDMNIEMIHALIQPGPIANYLGLAAKKLHELEEKSDLSREEARQYARLALGRAYEKRFLELPGVLDAIRTSQPGSTSWQIKNWPSDVRNTFHRFVSMATALRLPLESLNFRDLLNPRYTPPFPAYPIASAHRNLETKTLLDDVGFPLLEGKIQVEKPDLIGISVPYSDQYVPALKIAARLKEICPDVPVVVGGGFFWTSYRDVTDPEFFRVFDCMVLDDGEKPLLELTRVVSDRIRNQRLDFKRVPNLVYVSEHGEVKRTEKKTFGNLMEYPAPDFTGIPFHLYFNKREAIELPLMMAHGCYWNKCTFCDQLPYVTNYRPQTADSVFEKVREMVKQTGIRRVHFVDEACPPKMVRAFCDQVIRAHFDVRWRGNIRFEKLYTSEFCRTMKAAGCFQVHGGLEAATDRILRRINKGIGLEDMLRTIENFSQAQIRVHTYLIVGFPTETRAEAEAGAARVLDFIRSKKIHSCAWHGYVLGAESIVAMDPKKFGVLASRVEPNMPPYVQIVEATEGGMGPKEIEGLREDLVRRTDLAVALANSQFALAEEGRDAEDRDHARYGLLWPGHIVATPLRFSVERAFSMSEESRELLEPRESHLLINLDTDTRVEITRDLAQVIAECSTHDSIGDALDQLHLNSDEKASVAQKIYKVASAVGLLLR